MCRLDLLASKIIALVDQEYVTPVIVSPRDLSLRADFFIELGETIAGLDRSCLRIDWVPSYGDRSFFMGGDRWLIYHINRQIIKINRKFQDLAEETKTPLLSTFRAGLSASFGRSEGSRNDLIIGYCDDSIKLPAWSKQLRLTDFPR